MTCKDTVDAVVRTFGTHGTIVVREWATERSKVFSLNAGIRVKTLAIDTMLSSGIVSDFFVSTVGTQFVRIIYPPAIAMCSVVAWVGVCASAYFTYSVGHILSIKN